GMRAVGWYCSHTRSSVAMNANDCSIMERFFGERGSIALIMKPTRFGPAEATFHVQGCAEAGPHFSVLVARVEKEQCEEVAPVVTPVLQDLREDSAPSLAKAPEPWRLHVPALVRWAAM